MYCSRFERTHVSKAYCIYFSLEDIVPVQLLPEIVVSTPSTAGHLMAEWHQIPKGTVISVAMGDLQCSVYAAQPGASDAGMLDHNVPYFL